MSNRTKMKVQHIRKTNRKYTMFLAVFLTAQLVSATITAVVTSNNTKNSALSFGKIVAEEQMKNVENYISKQEERIVSFASNEDIYDLLNYETNNNNNVPSIVGDYGALKKRVQNYVENVTNEEDEGIYVSNTNTKVLAHSNEETVGITIRTNTDSRTLLLNELTGAGSKPQDKPYNAGIILSPVGNHDQIISLYKGIFDKTNSGKLLGYVGMGTYVDDISFSKIDTLPSASYSLIKIDDMGEDTYIYDEDETNEVVLVTKDGEGNVNYSYKKVEDSNILKLCSNFRRNPQNIAVTNFYEDGDNVNIIAYSKEYNMMLKLRVAKTELYASSYLATRSLIVNVIISLIIAVAIAVINVFIVKTTNSLNKAIKKQEDTKDLLQQSIGSDLATKAKSRNALASFVYNYNMGTFDNNSKIKCDTDESYFFAYHKICGITQYNTQFGEVTTDTLLEQIAEELKNAYGDENVYRTGDSEFVCTIKSKDANQSNLINKITDVHRLLCTTQKIKDEENIVVTPVVMSSVIKEGTELSIHTVTELKNLAEANAPIINKMPFFDYKIMKG